VLAPGYQEDLVYGLELWVKPCFPWLNGGKHPPIWFPNGKAGFSPGETPLAKEKLLAWGYFDQERGFPLKTLLATRMTLAWDSTILGRGFPLSILYMR
jgi:hypothetical protein